MTAVMIAVAGIAFIVIVAVVVGIMDVVQARTWRRIAAERRENWEARQLAQRVPMRTGQWDE
jgi:hypothetical protein